MSDESDFIVRVVNLVADIDLGMDCDVRVGETDGRLFLQIECWRRDVITGEMGFGHGGKYYPSMHATDNEIVQAIFGLYRGYWEHEARENFTWRGRRIFGPHISIDALYEAAPHVDVRSAQHVEDQP